MSLDFEKAAGQIEGMVEVMRGGEVEWGRHLDTALATLKGQATDLASLKTKIAESKLTWLVAGLDESPDARHPAPELPADYTALSTDGSHIDVDRHGPARCYLINIGSVVLRYGSQPEATLRSEPYLYANEDDMVIRDSDSNQEQLVTGALLGVKRMVEECGALLRLVEEKVDEGPAVALLDGSLVMWGLSGQSYTDFVRKAMLDEGLLRVFEGFKGLAEGRPLALASYISYPRSTDVVNALRVAICPHKPYPDCDLHCSRQRSRNTGCSACVDHPEGHRECDEVSMITDRHLFQELLSPGERSAIFTSRSSIVREKYGEHQVQFFYVNVGEEVARVEMPGWVARRRELVDLTHAVLLDQCERGHGYPVAISEAHEQAVVTGADREAFWQMVDVSMGGDGLSPGRSAKNLSKQTRWV